MDRQGFFHENRTGGGQDLAPGARNTTTRLKGPQNLVPLLLLLLLNLLVPHIIIESEALINVTLFQVPASARVGETRRLRCTFKLNGGETLHAMKLFKDEKEFYRYSPGAREPADRKMVFPVAGVQVDMRKSDEKDVVLRSLTRQSAGMYKCLVSVEDTFKSVSQEKRMEVSEAPQGSSAWNQMVPTNDNRQQARHKLGAGQSVQLNGNSQLTPSLRGQQLGVSSPSRSSAASLSCSFRWQLSLSALSASIALMLYLQRQQQQQQLVTS